MAERRARRRPGENRERLLEAGLIEFGLFGYHGASTAAIAARADVPQPHVYASFRTKQELFLACVALACAGVETATRTPADVCGDGAARRAADPEHRPVEHADLQRIVLQATSVVRDSALRGVLEPELTALRSLMGERAFSALLTAAATSLLPSAQHR